MWPLSASPGPCMAATAAPCFSIAAMTRGQPQMTIAVVPDSGADELAGISGNLAIQIVDGKHFYNFDYTLSETS